MIGNLIKSSVKSLFSSKQNNQKTGVSLQSRRGFILAISVLIISILATIGITGALLAFRELSITYVSSESNHAFYSADSSLECVLYRDLHDNNRPFWFNTENNIMCGTKSINFLSKNIYGDTDVIVLTTFKIEYDRQGSAVTKDCAYVEVSKVFNGDPRLSTSQPITTNVSAYGRTHCEISDEFGVERVLHVGYFHKYE